MSINSIVGQAADPHVFLSGRPPLAEYLGFVTTTVGGSALDVGALTESWRQANDHVQELCRDEATYADNPPIAELPEHLRGLGDLVLADPMVQRAFSIVPVKIGIVELDRLVVWQKHINLSHVGRLTDALGPAPSEEDVFNLCLPLDRRLDPPTVAGPVAPNTWAFACDSNDFRVLDAKLIDANTLDDLAINGAPTYVVAAVLGFGSNMLGAIQADGRLVLNNGSHRAYALRESGLTHVPCLIQVVTRRDELAVIGSGDLATNPDAYLTAPRPPVLRDYFDDKLRVVAPVPRKQRQVRVQLSFEQVDVPAA
jgi:hypothetical protein